MSRILFFRLVLITMFLHFNSAISQPDHFAYAVTAVNKGGSEWVALRKLDIRTGEFGSILVNIQDNDQNLFDVPAAKTYAYQVVSNPVNNISSNINTQGATGSSVAAIAYDRKNNR